MHSLKTKHFTSCYKVSSSSRYSILFRRPVCQWKIRISLQIQKRVSEQVKWLRTWLAVTLNLKALYKICISLYKICILLYKICILLQSARLYASTDVRERLGGIGKKAYMYILHTLMYIVQYKYCTLKQSK